MCAVCILYVTNSYADLELYVLNSQGEYQRIYGHDFGNVPVYPEGISDDPLKILDVYVRNTGDYTVTNIIPTISGNQNEIYPSPGCTELEPYDVSLGECAITITYNPIHYGKKNKRFTVEGTENIDEMTSNEVTVTIPITGTSDNANKTN
jgi:hypothetical protein